MLYNNRKKNTNFLPESSMTAKEASGIIKDLLIDEGKARQNLATFCQTYMEEEATALLAETFQKNAIDKSEYPQTAQIEKKCIDIIANLWNVSSDEDFIGTSTVGSSEACMLAGMAMKFRWRANAEKRGLDISRQKPNIIISSAFQVCWEKFCVYWDIEMRTVPINPNHLSLDTDLVLDSVDDYTIGIVGILGITYTGAYDNIEKLDKIVSEYNKSHEHNLVIHIDGASGGLFVPFTESDLKWDFRLSNVVSISTSGHKYGLVYPGVGWVVWRDKKYLPKELIFEVSYLGGSMPTIALNFSRSASQIIGQYYNFLRLGFEGYEAIHKKTNQVAMSISKAINETGYFDILNDGSRLPIVCYKLKKTLKWNLYDLADRLMMKGWQVPAYPLPNNMKNIVIQRIVCRGDFSKNLSELFIRDLQKAICDLNNAHILYNNDKNKEKEVYGFTH